MRFQIWSETVCKSLGSDLVESLLMRDGFDRAVVVCISPCIYMNLSIRGRVQHVRERYSALVSHCSRITFLAVFSSLALDAFISGCVQHVWKILSLAHSFPRNDFLFRSTPLGMSDDT